MDRKALLAFIQRILDSTGEDLQARTMLLELQHMLMETARTHPEDEALLKPLSDAIGSVFELRAILEKEKKLTDEELAIAKKRADERRAREEMYPGRC